MINYRLLPRAVTIGLLASCLVACSEKRSSWKEEALLHDGRTMVVERSQTYGGRSEPGQSGPIREHQLAFTVPGSAERITWTSEYDDDLGRANFHAMAVHVLGQIPYVVAWPNLCLSYDKWGRPNPPYVIFRRTSSQWERIALKDLPEQFTSVNLTFGKQRFEADVLALDGVVTADKIKELTASPRHPEFQKILREPLSKERIQEMCPQYPPVPKAPT